MTREGTSLVIKAEGSAVATLHLKSRAEGAKFLNGALRIPLPAVETAIGHGLPQPGSTTQQLKVIDQQSCVRLVATHTLRARAKYSNNIHTSERQENKTPNRRRIR